jgi:hypothetical protein
LVGDVIGLVHIELANYMDVDFASSFVIKSTAKLGTLGLLGNTRLYTSKL